MSQIVPANYFVPSLFTGIIAYFGGLTLWNTIKDAIVQYEYVLTSWVIVLQENIGLFRNTTSPLAIFTLYIVSLQLTTLQYLAYITFYVLVQATYSIYKTGYSLTAAIQGTYNNIQYYLDSSPYSEYSLDYYIAKEYPVALSPLIVMFAVVSFLYISKHLIQFERRVVKKETLPAKHPMTLRSSSKRASLLLTDHSLG
jgi:hypothetical protein